MPDHADRADHADLAAALDAALRQVDRAIGDDLRTLDGRSARPELARLRADLHAERAAALARGGADPAWVRRTVRWLVEGTPETELALVAALGAIARATPATHG